MGSAGSQDHTTILAKHFLELFLFAQMVLQGLHARGHHCRCRQEAPDALEVFQQEPHWLSNQVNRWGQIEGFRIAPLSCCQVRGKVA